jgi:integrative and conjugative element protein (TIGR02256 family)
MVNSSHSTVRRRRHLLEAKKLIIQYSVYQELLAHRQKSSDAPEAGGVLLGRHLIESDNIVIDMITTPQTNDRRSRYGFYRSADHNLLAGTYWQQMNGCMAYLGLWHTHPEYNPSPSFRDMNDWSKAVKTDIYHKDFLFFIIVGLDDLKVWWQRQGTVLRALERLT